MISEDRTNQGISIVMLNSQRFRSEECNERYEVACESSSLLFGGVRARSRHEHNVITTLADKLRILHRINVKRGTECACYTPFTQSPFSRRRSPNLAIMMWFDGAHAVLLIKVI